MDLPVMPPLDPMLAKSVATIPPADALPGGSWFEPKYDGFRCIVFRDGDDIQLGSRGKKLLTKYFPELVERLAQALPQRCVLDGELVVRQQRGGVDVLDWDALAQRIHPADSRIKLLADTTPAEFIAFDALAVGDGALLGEPFAQRRAALEQLGLPGSDVGVHLSPGTTDVAQAQAWFTDFEGAGLDGLIVKSLAGIYRPGVRDMLKVKHQRTADVVVIGYRVHTSGVGVGSLLLGLYHGQELIGVGGAASFTAKRREELLEELASLVLHNDDGEVQMGSGDKNRFSSGRDTSFIRVRPELVAEVGYNQMEARRFRHPAKLLRFRPDRDAASCTFEQLERPARYDLSRVLTFDGPTR